MTFITNNLPLQFDHHNLNGSNALTFISHAHGDHLKKLNPNEQNYLTYGTRDIARITQKEYSGNVFPIKLKDSVKFDGFEVVAHNAGHMLGSAQFEIKTPDCTYVYTGDINCKNMFTTTAAEKIPCDILILETTYGVPFYTFPDLTQTATEMVDWALKQIKIGRIPMFKVYSGGKAQEIIKIFNIMTKIPVVADGVVACITDAYINNGIKLEYVKSETKEAHEMLKSGECICLDSSNRNWRDINNVSIAVATGWALGKKFEGINAAFPLSGHADFEQLIEYVNLVKPKEIFTIHGFKTEFADYIKRKIGIKAKPIPPIKQKLLKEYL